MVCCPKWLCPRWYSGVVASITLLEDGRVRIANNSLEREGKSVVFDATEDVRNVFLEEGISSDYGFVTVKSKVPDGNTPEDALVVSFVSFYRKNHNPDHEIEKRVKPAAALKEYDRLFDELFDTKHSAS